MKLLTVTETAGILRVTRQWVYRLAGSGSIPAIRLGRAVRVDEGRLHELLAHGGWPTRKRVTSSPPRDGGAHKAQKNAVGVGAPTASMEGRDGSATRRF